MKRSPSRTNYLCVSSLQKKKQIVRKRKKEKEREKKEKKEKKEKVRKKRERAP